MKKLLLLILLCSPLEAAITFDAVSTSSTAPTGAASITWNHTVGSGCSNAVLIVSVSTQDETVEAPQSVTYKGVGLTHQLTGEVNTTFSASSWYMKDSLIAGKGTSGAILVTYAISTKNQILGTARSYCGVDQATTFGTAVTANGTATTSAVTVTSATGELVVDMITASFGATSLTVVAPQTQRSNILATSNSYNATSEEAGASSVTTNWTLGVSHYWVMIAVPLKPSGAAASIAPILLSHKRRRSQ